MRDWLVPIGVGLFGFLLVAVIWSRTDSPPPETVIQVRVPATCTQERVDASAYIATTTELVKTLNQGLTAITKKNRTGLREALAALPALRERLHAASLQWRGSAAACARGEDTG